MNSSPVLPRVGVVVSCILSVFVMGFGGCSVAKSAKADRNTSTPPAAANSSSKSGSIPIEPNGPADTVRAFYGHLREKRFREAIFLTNLRPAVDGLTDAELKEFALDFAAIAGQVPAILDINGEIISGDKATVTAILPHADSDKNELQTVRLKKAGQVWVIQTVDEGAEARINKEGKQYFYNLRIETHEEEARRMLERVAKAQIAHSLQNAGLFAERDTLIGAGLLPDDIRTSESTGYNYSIDVSPDKRKYSATATPALYGKSGRLSFLLEIDGKGISRVRSTDNGGKVMRK